MEAEHLSEKDAAVPKKTLTAAWIKSNLAGMGPRVARYHCSHLYMRLVKIILYGLQSPINPFFIYM